MEDDHLILVCYHLLLFYFSGPWFIEVVASILCCPKMTPCSAQLINSTMILCMTCFLHCLKTMFFMFLLYGSSSYAPS
jgi:hypothetical protein